MNIRNTRFIAVLFVMLLITGPAFAALDLGAEVHVGKDIASPSQTYEHLGGVAWNGTNGLAVWVEQYASVVGTRLTADGTPLDPDGIPLVRSGTGVITSAIVADGDGYLLLWATSTNLFASQLTIDSSGHATLDHPEGIVIATSAFLIDVRVATNGDRFLVAFQDNANGNTTTLAVLLDRNGTPLTASIPIDTAIAYRTRVASNGSSFAVTTGNTNWGTTLTILDHDGHIASKGVVTSSIASDVTPLGPAYLVSWSVEHSIGDTIVAPDGSITAINTVATPGAEPLDSVATEFNGTEGVITYEMLGARGCTRCVSARTLGAIFFGADGKAIGDPLTIASDLLSNSNARIVWSGSTFVSVYEWQSGMFDLLPQIRSVAIGPRTIVPPTKVSTPKPLLRSVLAQDGAAASNDHDLLVVTAETGESSLRLLAGEYEFPNPGSQAVSIASDGSDWLVIWSASDGVAHASLFDTQRQFERDSVLPLPPNGAYAVTFDGSDYVVVGSDLTGVRAVRVRRSGSVVETAPVVLLPGYDIGSPGRIPAATITGFNGRSVVSITTQAPGCICTKLLTWVITDGEVIASDVPATPNRAYTPDSSNDGVDAYVVGELGDIVRVDGTTAQATLLANDAKMTAPSIARLGLQFLIVWSDGTAGLLSTSGAIEALPLTFPAGSKLFRTPEGEAAGITYSRTNDDPPYNGATLFYLRSLFLTRNRLVEH